jgi:hypothetical protein
MRLPTASLLLLLFAASLAGAETVRVQAAADATVIENPAGAKANGRGKVFFAGRTNQAGNSIRRTLIYFEIAGLVPRGAIIESASVFLFLTSSNPEPSVVSLHRVLTGWTEGQSASSGGGGAASQAGDVTWMHTTYNSSTWPRPGGHYIDHPSAETEVTSEGFHLWTDPGMISDIRSWAAAPGRNLGWILIGDESEGGTAKRFSSREEPDVDLRPFLEVSYSMAPGRE